MALRAAAHSQRLFNWLWLRLPLRSTFLLDTGYGEASEECRYYLSKS